MTRRDLGGLGLLGIVLLLIFFDPWFTGRTFFARDLTYLFHPMFTWTAENLQAGRLPAWTPYVSGGAFWMGQPQTGVYSVGNLLFWFAPFVAGLKIFHALHLFVAALGGWLWARSAGASARGAALAALLWSLNGFFLARREFLPLFSALAWTPWLMLAGRSRRGAVPGALLAGGVGAILLTGGYWPQAAWTWILAAASVLAGPRAGARAKSYGAGFALALLWSAPALLPGLDLLLRSDRWSSGIGDAVAASHALRPSAWAGLVFPSWSGGSPASFPGERFYWLGCFYVGVTGALLAAWGFRRAEGRRRWVWAGLFLLGALLSAGNATPLFGWARGLPIFKSVRFAGQYAFWMTSVALVLATGALARLTRRRVLGALGVALVLELGVYAWRSMPTIDSNYFRFRPDWIRWVQEDPLGRRFFPTPRAVNDTSSSGATWTDAWANLRSKLLSLGPLPYHVRNLNPVGFSLNAARTEEGLNRLYGAPGIDAARPHWRSMDVGWVAAPSPLAAPDLRLRSTSPWFFYERTDASSTAPRAADPSPNRLRLRGPFPAGPVAVGEMFDPGWRAWADGRPVPLEDREGLMVASLDAPAADLRMIFHPPSVRWGALLGVWALCVSAAAALCRLRRWAA